MKTYVLDTSALLRLFLPDGPLPDHLEEILDQAGRGDARVCIPGLALAEAGQVLRKKELVGVLSPTDSREILDTILALPLEMVPDQTLVSDALDLARETQLTVYDGLFLALALQRRATLITADAKLESAWNRSASPPDDTQ
jgi:predicted nucleic acid-binding protein